MDFYKIICVKRKFDEDLNYIIKQQQQSKRLCHLGCFTEKYDVNGLNSTNILAKNGFNDRKRIRIDDVDAGKFQDYLELKITPSKIIDESKNGSSISNINNNKSNITESSSIPAEECNIDTIDIQNSPMNDKNPYQESFDDEKSIFVYDYYIFNDDFDNSNEFQEYRDDEEPSSNDENYRYNDYPDENDAVFTDTDDDESVDSFNEEDYLDLQEDFDNIDLLDNYEDCSDDYYFDADEENENSEEDC
ncbi:hypothetical protein SSS_04979 [Sarcoptes scabiei]|uniref:RNA polymerase II nuclear localization protein SLC7A6OS n=1 Tax=Sarcoptes scabiei TaxID=52283 RepID=A0A834RB33_SARSC|nr:hypothetical protein SSS_04979 [Sarcoptes scabiei]